MRRWLAALFLGIVGCSTLPSAIRGDPVQLRGMKRPFSRRVGRMYSFGFSLLMLGMALLIAFVAKD